MTNLKKNYHFEDANLKNFINLTEEEKELVRNWRNNKDVRLWMYSDAVISPKEHFKFINRLHDDTKNYYWLVTNKKKERIGVIYLNKIDIKNKNAYLGIYTNPDCKLKGRGILLIEHLKRLAFEICKLHTLKLEVIDTNKKAISFYKKSGFIEEGRLKEFVFKNGNWYDVIIMGFIKREGDA